MWRHSRSRPVSGPHAPRDERVLLHARPGCLRRGSARRRRDRPLRAALVVIEAVAPTLQAASDAIAAAIRRRMANVGSGDGGGGDRDGGAKMAVRVQAFPKPLEPRLVELMRSSGAVEPEHREGLVAFVSYVFGGLCVGLVETTGEFGPAFLASMSAGVSGGGERAMRPGRTNGGQAKPPSALGTATAAASAATATRGVDASPHSGDPQMGGQVPGLDKLREVASRLDMAPDVRHAIDVGASPGGWTTCPARPAANTPPLSIPAASSATGRRGLGRMTPSQEPERRRSKRAAAEFLEMLVCDMNAPPADVAIATHALPLLAAGATLVLTFKNSFARKAEWHAGPRRRWPRSVASRAAWRWCICLRTRPRRQRSWAVLARATGSAPRRPDAAASAEEAAATRRLVERRTRAASTSCATTLSPPRPRRARGDGRRPRQVCYGLGTSEGDCGGLPIV